MLEEIKSVKVKKINNAFNSNNVDEGLLNLMAELNEKELAEFFYLIEEGTINYNILPYYFISYETDKVKNIEEKMEYNFINKLFAIAWEDNLSDKDEQTLLKMLYGMAIMTTDLVERIRKGFELNQKKQKMFDSQIKKIIKELINTSENNNLYKVLTKVDSKDQNVITEGDTFYALKNDLLSLSNVVELYDLIHGDYTGKDYLAANNKNISYEKELREDIKNYFKKEEVSKMRYLPSSYKELIISCISGNSNVKEIESVVLDKKNSQKRKNLLDSLNVDSDEDYEEPKLKSTSEERAISALDRVLNGNSGKQKIKEKIEITPLSSNDLILDTEKRESLSIPTIVARTMFAGFLIFALIGWGLSIKTDNNNDTDHIKNITYEEILSYKLSSGTENKYDMKINRSKGDINNGTVEQISPNIQ